MLQCGTTTNEQLKIELLSQWKLEAEFRKINRKSHGGGGCRNKGLLEGRFFATLLFTGVLGCL